MGETTVKTPSRMVISIPSPPNFPRVSTCVSRKSSGDIKEVWGSRVWSIPRMAP